MTRAAVVASLCVLVACSSTTTVVSSSSGAPEEDAGTDAAAEPAGPFTLTSTAFEEGGVIPTAHACHGANTSPPLAWSGAPTDTKSFAIIFNDRTTDFLHSVIYDIPATTTELPANVQKTYQPSNVPGAKQTRAYTMTYGYAGPCPQEMHTYEFVLYALDVEALPGVTQTTARADAVTAIEAHGIASTKLTGTYTPP